MYSHVTIGTNDHDRAKAFYDAVLGTVGVVCYWSDGRYTGYGTHRECEFWILPPFDGGAATVGNGDMTAFKAANGAQVDAFHSAALANGGRDEGPPGRREAYHEHYYGCYVRDPDGHEIHCVCHLPDPEHPSSHA